MLNAKITTDHAYCADKFGNELPRSQWNTYKNRRIICVPQNTLCKIVMYSKIRKQYRLRYTASDSGREQSFWMHPCYVQLLSEEELGRVLVCTCGYDYSIKYVDVQQHDTDVAECPECGAIRVGTDILTNEIKEEEEEIYEPIEPVGYSTIEFIPDDDGGSINPPLHYDSSVVSDELFEEMLCELDV